MSGSESPLLIVDVQNGFVNRHSKHVVPVIRRLATEWLDRGAPVFMSQFVNREGSQWERLLGWSRLESEAEIAIHPALRGIGQLAVTYKKETYTCLSGPFLDELREANWTDVVLCGIATDSCVLATAIDLFEFDARKIRPIVVKDACASQAGQRVNDAGLLLLERFIGRDQIVSSEDVLAPPLG